MLTDYAISSWMLSTADSWLLAAVNEVSHQAASIPNTPGEPSTLIQAAIGIGVVTIYVFAIGLRRAGIRGRSNKSLRLADYAGDRPKTSNQRRSRDAA